MVVVNIVIIEGNIVKGKVSHVLLLSIHRIPPANTQRSKNIVTASLQRRDVAATL